MLTDRKCHFVRTVWVDIIPDADGLRRCGYPPAGAGVGDIVYENPGRQG